MGIRGLNTLIKKLSENSITENDIKKYSGSKIAIDCSILLYKFKYACKSENSHLVGIANRVKYYIGNGILPIFIFDGSPPDEKKNTILKRQTAKYKTYLKIDQLKIEREDPTLDAIKINSIDNEINKLLSQIIYIKKHHIEESKTLLEKSGVPYITAPEDAEKYCAFLQRNNLVDYTVSDDTDTITFGCEKILKTSINGKITEINLNKILEDFKMDMDMFIDFCILSGCDYCDTINQIGPVTSYNSIIKYKNIENFLKTLKEVNDNFDYISARKIFKEFEYEKINKDLLVMKKYNKEELLEFLNLHEFKQNVISKFLKILN